MLSIIIISLMITVLRTSIIAVITIIIEVEMCSSFFETLTYLRMHYLHTVYLYITDTFDIVAMYVCDDNYS